MCACVGGVGWGVGSSGGDYILLTLLAYFFFCGLDACMASH